MANSVDTQVLSVDTGKAISNLKEFKARIEELKGVLLGAKEGTEEWTRASKELKERQEKLNQVMEIAKGRTAEAEGSYYSLNKQLVELRKQYKSLSEESRNGIVGANMLKGIQDLDLKLKDLDAGMGQFQRNVGNYSGAFQDAFDKMLGPLGKVGGSFGTLARDVKGMIPLIKTINTTAISGLKGIKAAIASTGIGLLVVAAGELAAHWEDITNWIREATGWTDKAAEAEARHKRELEDAANAAATITKELEKQATLRAAEGMPEWLNLKGQNEALEKIKSEWRQKIRDLEDWNILYKDAPLKEQRDQVERNKQKIAEYEKIVKGLNDDIEKNKTKIEAAAKKINYEAEQALKTEEERLRAQYESNKKLLEEQGIDTTALTDKFEKDLKNLNSKAEKLHSTTRAAIDDVKRAAEQLAEQLSDSMLTPFEKLDKTYEKNKEILDKAHNAGKISEETYLQAIENLGLNYVKDWEALIKETQDKFEKETIDTAQKAAQGALKEIEKTLSQAKIDLDFSNSLSKVEMKPEKMGFLEGIGDAFNNIFGSQDSIIEAYSQKAKQLNDIFELNKNASLERIKVYEDELSKLPEGSQEFLDVQTKLSEEKMNLNNLETQNFLDNLELQEEQEEKQAEARKARWQMFQMGLTATANLLTQFANAQQKQIQDDVKNGKITEEQAKKKFKTVKSMQYASTVINTATAAQGAYSAMASIPYVGPALGIAAAAAATISGLAQLKQIKAQQFGDTSSNTPSTPNLQPIVENTYTPTYTANMTGDSELSNLANALNSQPIVVKVSDIEAGTKASNERTVETTF